MSGSSTGGTTPSSIQKTLYNLSCGGISGVLSRTLVSPLERLKILYQVQYVTLNDKRGAKKYGSVVDSLKLIFREEGFRGFYKGNGANCVRVFPYVGIQFASFSQFTTLLKPGVEKPILSPLEKLGVGACAGIASVLLTYPLDLVRGRLTASGGALENTMYTGILDCLSKTVRAEGVRGLYNGISPTLLGIGPYVGINFLVYETLKEHAPVAPGAVGPSAVWLALCGGVAGTTGQTIAYPLDLLRRRFQMQTLPGSTVRYANPWDAIVQVVRDEGVSGLYKGYLPNFIKTWPTIAFMFFANDMLKRNAALKQLFGVTS